MNKRGGLFSLWHFCTEEVAGSITPALGVRVFNGWHHLRDEAYAFSSGNITPRGVSRSATWGNVAPGVAMAPEM